MTKLSFFERKAIFFLTKYDTSFGLSSIIVIIMFTWISSSSPNRNDKKGETFFLTIYDQKSFSQLILCKEERTLFSVKSTLNHGSTRWLEKWGSFSYLFQRFPFLYNQSLRRKKGLFDNYNLILFLLLIKETLESDPNLIKLKQVLLTFPIATSLWLLFFPIPHFLSVIL